jgi:hypothetical protein
MTLSAASVFILASRVTAIEITTYLVENEHKCIISFVSTQGRFPKLQSEWVYYPRR